MRRPARTRRHSGIRETFLRTALLSLALLAAAWALAGEAAADGDEEEGGPAKSESSFLTPIMGWSSEKNHDYHYLVPVYYHRCNWKNGSSKTLVFPLLTGFFSSGRSPVSTSLLSPEKVELNGAASLPLLAIWGNLEGERISASGYASPYFTAVSIDQSSDEAATSRSETSILPILGSFRLNLYSRTSLEAAGGSFSRLDAVSLPGLDVSLYDSRRAGIESDRSFLDIWGISLCRQTTDLPGCGFKPWFREFDALGRPGRHRSLAGLDLLRSHPAGLTGALDTLTGSRSGAPLDHTGLLDPMITWERQGESLKSVGIEPLFHYDTAAGLSLPILLATISGDGVTFGAQAARHLFPLVHGNEEGTRWDFLLNYGTVYDMEGYTAVDLKLLFNYQTMEGRGTAWGFLPFFFGRYPGYDLNPGARFVQLDNHLLSSWNVDGLRGIDLLHPFLFSWSGGRDEARWRALLFFGAERKKKNGTRKHDMLLYNCMTTEQGDRKFGLLPLNVLFHYERESTGDMKHSALWSLLYSYRKRSDEGGGKSKLALGPLGLLYKQNSRLGGFRNSSILGLLHSYKSAPEKSDLRIGPFGLLFSRESDRGNRLSHSALWSLLYSYERGPAATEFSLGPFGFPFTYDSGEDSFKTRLFWILGYRSQPGLVKFDFLGLPLLQHRTKTVPMEKQ